MHVLYRPVFISSRLPNIPLFQLSRSQIIQLVCVLISPKLQLAGYLVGIIIPRYLGIVCKISHYLAKYPAICPVRLHQTEDSQYARTLSKISRADFLKVKFQVSGSNLELMKTRFCNFRIISQIRNSGLFGNLELMKTHLMSACK